MSWLQNAEITEKKRIRTVAELSRGPGPDSGVIASRKYTQKQEGRKESL